MGTSPAHHAVGLILSVQEQRFRLMTRSGQGLLLTLAKNASASPADLERWRDSRAAVSVLYTGRPNYVDGVAQRVQPAEAEH
ncbi:MAG TPA: hypothetical protein VHO48_12620 [Anaerolineaceae bacterium]|jgi:hypothetical protein|nr:hypothetical protein [Anaerolineaceae bacterium]